MEPNKSGGLPNFNKQPGGNFNAAPQGNNVEINSTPDSGYDNFERKKADTHEQLAAAELLAQPAQTLQPAKATPDPASTSQPTTTVQAIQKADPSTAQDNDRIEKEWVDRTKEVLTRTRDDPYEQARQISALMRDYVKKRYGKEVGKASDL